MNFRSPHSDAETLYGAGTRLTQTRPAPGIPLTPPLALESLKKCSTVQAGCDHCDTGYEFEYPISNVSRLLPGMSCGPCPSCGRLGFVVGDEGISKP